MFRRCALATILVAALLASVPRAQSPDGPAGILRDRIERQAAVGLALGIVEDGAPRFTAAGSRTKGGPVVDERTVFEIGSVSKVFTTTLLAEMVARGEVTLETPVQALLPAAVKMPSRNGKAITLLDLATASSGLPRLPGNLAPTDVTNPYADYTADRLYAFLSGYTLARDPGASYEYSNLGMGLLGHALALKAGRSYEALVTERILVPLGMRETVITLTPALRERLAAGHAGDLEPAANWDLDALAGAGAWRSTMADMVKFAAAAANPPEGTLGKALAMAMSPRLDTGRPGLRIGLGWHVLEREGRRLVWHNGQTGGYHAFLGVDPAANRGVVLLGNAAISLDDIGMHLLDPSLPLQPPAAPRPTVPVAEQVLQEYAGRYELAPGFAIDVRREGDALYVQATGQQAFRAFPASATRFFLRGVEAEIEFVRAPDGAVTGLVLYQGGRETKGKRVTK